VRFARALRAASFLALGGRAVANTEHTSLAFRALAFDCRAAILHFDSLRVGNFALGLALNTISSGHFILDIENFARQNNAHVAKNHDVSSCLGKSTRGFYFAGATNTRWFVARAFFVDNNHTSSPLFLFNCVLFKCNLCKKIIPGVICAHPLRFSAQ